jgi:hypothetical protein
MSLHGMAIGSSNNMTQPQNIMIVVGVPPDYADQVLDAVAQAGGAITGDYTHCSFSNPGTGTFKPGEAANPHTGEKGMLNRVTETRIETFCDITRAKAVAQAIRAAHPYEEPVIYLIPLLSVDDLPD